MTTTQHRAYSVPMHETTAAPELDMPTPYESLPMSEWRALWVLEEGQPAWLRESVATLDGAIQGEMGHT